MSILNKLFYNDDIDNLTYQTVYVEKPVADIVGDIDWKNILAAPPKNSSSITIKELKLLSRYALNRTKEDLDFINRVDTDIDSFFISITDSHSIEYPYQTINEAYKIIRPIILNIKNLWNRPRPYQLAKYYSIPLEMVITNTHDTPSYPSGHVVYAKLAASIIQDLYGRYIDKYKLTKVVDQIGLGRIKQGVHYPSDNKASIILVDRLYNTLKERMSI